MIIKDIVVEDFCNYKKPSLFIIFPYCSFKCDKECGKAVCQNSHLVKLDNKEISLKTLINYYINNNITSAIVLGGLEPFDSWEDLLELIKEFRKVTKDDIVIYTGYTEKELSEKLNFLTEYDNIIVKFGRFIPDNESHLDPVLGIYLSSENQYARRIS
jgi:organic radical activating enzyme